MKVRSLQLLLTSAAVLAAFSASGARAQSSVSLYGELDAGLAYVNNAGGHSLYQATSGMIDGSFWGLHGSEDLGGGNHAIFTLERGFSVANGEGANDHPYYVGLSNDAYGTLTLGHQYDSIYDYFAPFTLTGGTGGTAFAHPFDNDNANNSYLARNSLKYASPEFDGLSFGGMYAFSNSPGAFSNNRAYGFGAKYENGPLNAGAAYLHTNGRGRTDVGAYDPAALPGSGGAIFDAMTGGQNTVGVGANYAFGDFTLGLAWSRSIFTRITDADSDIAQPSIGFSNYEVNGVYQLTPAVSLAGMYTYTKAADMHWHMGALQTVYQVSKRTDFYLEAVYQRASSNAIAMINGVDPSSSRTQLLTAAGIRHRF